MATADDAIAVEEPLEIRLGQTENGRLQHRPVSITMRTPGDDFELAAGFLFTEGILQSREQVREIHHCGKGKGATNTLRVDLAEGVAVDVKRLERNFYTTSSCGVCGKTSIEALATGARTVSPPAGFEIDSRLIDELPARLQAQQHAFQSTGGLHASALFSRTGELLGLREDVGRHNALDKLVGSRFLAGALPANDTILFLSGRASFELLQKAVMAGIPVVCAVGAPRAWPSPPPGVRRDPARFRARPAVQCLHRTRTAGFPLKARRYRAIVERQQADRIGAHSK